MLGPFFHVPSPRRREGHKGGVGRRLVGVGHGRGGDSALRGTSALGLAGRNYPISAYEAATFYRGEAYSPECAEGKGYRNVARRGPKKFTLAQESDPEQPCPFPLTVAR